jgi:hypothetical protein
MLEPSPEKRLREANTPPRIWLREENPRPLKIASVETSHRKRIGEILIELDTFPRIVTTD